MIWITVPLLLVIIFLSSCTTEPETDSGNFGKLQQALQDRDAGKFCGALSRSSRAKILPSCREGIGSLWLRLDELFENTEPLAQRGRLFFLKKEGLVVSYPLRLEEGRWRADILGYRGWQK